MTAIPSDVGLEVPAKRSLLEPFSRWLLGLALLIVVGAFASFLLLALPANDDFMRATQPHMDQGKFGFGYLAYCHRLYSHWQGRWVSFGIESAVLSRGDMIKLYPALLGAVAVVNFAGIWALCRRLTSQGSEWFSLGCAVGLASLLWAEMPSVAQAVYWFTGVVENSMSLALGAILLVGMISLRASVPWMVFASLFAIIVCGLHEAYGAMLCIALAGGTVAAYWMKSANRVAWLVVLIAAVIGIGIVAGAPGNSHRMRSDGNLHSRQFAYDLRVAAAQFWHCSREWLFDPKLLGASLWVAFSPTLELSRPLWPTAKRVPWRLLLPLIWLAMLGAGFFAPSWAFGAEMPPRTLSANFVVFATGWLLIVFVWTRSVTFHDTASSATHGLRSIGGASVAKLILAAGLLLTGNPMDAMHDLATRHVLRWRSSVEARFASLRHGGDTDRVLPRQASSSRLLYAGELTPDPTYWANRGVADYFHVKSVRVLAPATMPATAPVELTPTTPEQDIKAPNM